MTLPRISPQPMVDVWALVDQPPGVTQPAFWTGTWAKDALTKALFTYSAANACFLRTESEALTVQTFLPGLARYRVQKVRVPRAYAAG